MNLLVRIFIGILIVFSVSAFADVSYRDESNSNNYITRTIFITGEIKQGDSRRLASVLKEPEHGSLSMVFLDSIGGDVNEALLMGDLLYHTDFGYDENINGKKVHLISPVTVVVSGPSRCASACVLIYASAVKRIAVGSIVVHNPYMTSTSLNYSEIRKAKEDIKSRFITQISRVSVSPLLWEIMISTPSSQARILSWDELVNLGLSGDDPNYQDYYDGFKAMVIGLSKAEYLKRKAHVEECLRHSPSLNDDKNPAATMSKCYKQGGLSPY